MDVPFLAYLPSEVGAGSRASVRAGVVPARPPLTPRCPVPTPQVQLINAAYRLVVDAVLGPGVELAQVGGPCTRALATLKQLSVPLVSLDIPSGTARGARETGRPGRPRGSCPQVTPAGGPPHAQLQCPLPTPWPCSPARADVSSQPRPRPPWPPPLPRACWNH